jgi:hypothetical protein
MAKKPNKLNYLSPIFEKSWQRKGFQLSTNAVSLLGCFRHGSFADKHTSIIKSCSDYQGSAVRCALLLTVNRDAIRGSKGADLFVPLNCERKHAGQRIYDC